MVDDIVNVTYHKSLKCQNYTKTNEYERNKTHVCLRRKHKIFN